MSKVLAIGLTTLGGLTVYCFGDPAKMSDESVRLALRVHDEVTPISLGPRYLYLIQLVV